jgi:preprotein translocase subunit SecG
MLLFYAVTALHVIVCIILVLVVLLQSGRGADLAGAFGGGATQTAFGSRGPASFLSKMTTVAAVVFMLTSLGLSLISTKTETKSILETGKQRQTTTTDSKKPVAPAKAVSSKTPEQIRQEVEELSRKNKQSAPAPAPAQQQNSGSKAAQPEQPAK